MNGPLIAERGFAPADPHYLLQARQTQALSFAHHQPHRLWRRLHQRQTGLGPSGQQTAAGVGGWQPLRLEVDAAWGAPHPEHQGRRQLY